ncbi:MAG: laccase domain-containing protein, partial [Bacteroidota bacterium]|nr:laccase domain-containing protein [Bacteroidota bacterium]
YCTVKDENLFFSHRRDKGLSGRMMVTIGFVE